MDNSDPAYSDLFAWINQKKEPPPPLEEENGLPLLDPNAEKPDKNQAAIIKARWEDWLKRFKPLEDDLFEKLFAPISKSADRAGEQVSQSYAASAQDRDAGLRRAGMATSDDAAQAMAKVSALNRARDIATAKNTTRRGLVESRMNMMGDLMGIGRGIAGSSQDSLASASSSQAAREAIGIRNRAAGKAGLWGAAGNAATGAAAGFMMGGPFGAVAGGALGLLSGLF